MTEKDKTENETFLNRWSRRKNTDDAELAKEEDVKAPFHNEQNDTDLNKADKAEKEAEEAEMAKNREAAESIDLETLDYDSNFEPFMKKGVPEVLKSLAMRKLWTSNPLLANVDGLNDYDENFADPALNFFKSDWKVGRGFLTDEDDEEERLRKLALEQEQEQENEQAEQLEEQDGQTAEQEIANSDDQEQDEQISTHELEDETVMNTQANDDEETTSENRVSTESEHQETAPLIKRVSLRKRLLES